ncbi:MAG TPA: hypothetical protein IAA69_02645, partial [Candidatus Aveggerthella stercoripullorum]|nr:hypothetical protein [Candidatus Aveggerthella stercoripullorum]
MGKGKAKAAVSTALAATLALGMMPGVQAFAEDERDVTAEAVRMAEQTAADETVGEEEAAAQDAKGELSAESSAEARAVEAGMTAEERSENVEATLASTRARGLVTGLSDEFKYFTKYESSCNYNQGFSYGD